LRVTNQAGVKTICLAQFKSLIPGGRIYTTGFGFPSDRNNLVIQNSMTNPLSSVQVQINGAGCTLDPTLTPGELYSVDMSNIGGVDCLFNDTSGSITLNQVQITAQGPAGAVAESVVWGVGPFVTSPLPE
jgi:hypothetical protein